MMRVDKNKYLCCVDPDETAPYEPSHLDLDCLSFGSRFLTDIHTCNNGHVQIQGRTIPLKKLVRHADPSIFKAIPWVLGNKGIRPFISGNKVTKILN